MREAARGATRNTVLKDSLSAALAKSNSQLKAQPPNKAQADRIEETKQRLRHRANRVFNRKTQENTPDPILALVEEAHLTNLPDADPPVWTSSANPQPVVGVVADETPQDVPPPPQASPQASPQAPTIAPLPPDLAWLDQPTPFNNYLAGIAGHLRDAKTRLNFTLSECLAREKTYKVAFEKAESDLLNEQVQIETTRKQLAQIDATIATCAVVAEQSLGIAPLLGPSPKHVSSVPGERKHMKPLPNDPTVCRKADIIKFFENNPGSNWSIAEIKAQMPLAKQVHAKKSIPPIVATLAVEGKIIRISEGVYRSA